MSLRIDAHQHFWAYDATQYGWIDESMSVLQRDFFPSDLDPELVKNGFGGCVAVQATHTRAETDCLLGWAAESNVILGVVGWIDLRSVHLRDELATLATNSKLVGIRHVVQSEPDDRFLLGAEFLRGIAALEEQNLAYDLLIYPKHLRVAAEFVRRFPRQRFVLDHLAKPPIKAGMIEPWARDIRALAAFPNVFCKLSGLVTEADWSGWRPEDFVPYLDVAFDCFGPDRLMVGSDWPVCTLAGSYSRTINIVENYMAQCAVEVREKVFGRNACLFYRLPVPTADSAATPGSTLHPAR